MKQLIETAGGTATRWRIPRLDGGRIALGISSAALLAVVVGLIIQVNVGPNLAVKLLRTLTLGLMIASVVVSLANLRRAPAIIGLALDFVTWSWWIKLM